MQRLRCFRQRCEPDALYFHLIRVGREDVDYIMETFPIVKRKDDARWGECRTKRVVLEEYEEMAGSVWREGEVRGTALDGPGACRRVSQGEH